MSHEPPGAGMTARLGGGTDSIGILMGVGRGEEEPVLYEGIKRDGADVGHGGLVARVGADSGDDQDARRAASTRWMISATTGLLVKGMKRTGGENETSFPNLLGMRSVRVTREGFTIYA